MEDYGFFQSWAAVFCAIIGTITWRIAGVVLASRIPADGPVMGWVNTMAYAMVSAVLLRIGNHRPRSPPDRAWRRIIGNVH